MILTQELIEHAEYVARQFIMLYFQHIIKIKSNNPESHLISDFIKCYGNHSCGKFHGILSVGEYYIEVNFEKFSVSIAKKWLFNNNWQENVLEELCEFEIDWPTEFKEAISKYEFNLKTFLMNNPDCVEDDYCGSISDFY